MVNDVNLNHNETVAEISIKDQYYNMKEMIDPQYTLSNWPERPCFPAI